MKKLDTIEPTRVLFVGPGWGQRGGIASVLDELKGSTDAFAARGVRIRFCETHSFESVGSLLRFLIADVPRFARDLIRGVDIVHFHCSIKGSFHRKLLLFAIAVMFRKRVVFHMHSGRFAAFLRESNRLVAFAARWALRASSAFVGVSNAVGDELVGAGGERTRQFIIGNSACAAERVFVRCPDNSPRLDNSPAQIIFAGRLSESKGVRDVLEAMAELARENVAAHVTFLGSGDIERWQQEAKRLSIAGHVSFVGWLAGEAKLERYGAAHIFCMPSHFESFGIATLEAMFAGLAVVGTRVGGFFDLVEQGRTGYLVSSSNPAELAKALRTLIQDPAMTAKMGQRGKERAYAQFSCDEIVGKYVDMYQRIMKRQK